MHLSAHSTASVSRRGSSYGKTINRCRCTGKKKAFLTDLLRMQMIFGLFHMLIAKYQRYRLIYFTQISSLAKCLVLPEFLPEGGRCRGRGCAESCRWQPCVLLAIWDQKCPKFPDFFQSRSRCSHRWWETEWRCVVSWDREGWSSPKIDIPQDRPWAGGPWCQQELCAADGWRWRWWDLSRAQSRPSALADSLGWFWGFFFLSHI